MTGIVSTPTEITPPPSLALSSLVPRTCSSSFTKTSPSSSPKGSPASATLSVVPGLPSTRVLLRQFPGNDSFKRVPVACFKRRLIPHQKNPCTRTLHCDRRTGEGEINARLKVDIRELNHFVSRIHQLHPFVVRDIARNCQFRSRWDCRSILNLTDYEIRGQGWCFHNKGPLNRSRPRRQSRSDKPQSHHHTTTASPDLKSPPCSPP